MNQKSSNDSPALSPAHSPVRQIIVHSTLSRFASGDSAYAALKRAVADLSRSAPKGCDILIEAFNLLVTEVHYLEPHSFIFHGLTRSGNKAAAVCHFAELVACVVYLPQKGPVPRMTSFTQSPSSLSSPISAV